ncbi:MAG: hypothetical protein ACI89D_002099 [Bermanella sp.]
MARVNQRVLGEGKQLTIYLIPTFTGISTLKIRAHAPANQQRIPSKNGGNTTGLKIKTERLIGVTRRKNRVKLYVAQGNQIAVADRFGNALGLGELAHNSHAICFITKLTQSRHMICVGVGVDGVLQAQLKITQQLQIALDLINNGINENVFSAFDSGE